MMPASYFHLNLSLSELQLSGARESSSLRILPADRYFITTVVLRTVTCGNGGSMTGGGIVLPLGQALFAEATSV